MNRKQIVFGLGLFVGILTLASLVCVRMAAAQPPEALIEEQAIVGQPAQPLGTIISGDITSDTTWFLAGSPYTVTSDISVAASATLTIEPGVVVLFDQYRGLGVEGKLLAEGTAAQPITFTGNFTTPASGWWSGLHVYYGTAQLDYVTVEYAGYSQGGSLQTNGGVVTVTRSAIRNGSADGVWAYGSGVIHVSDSLIAGNAGYALEYANSTVAPQLSGLTITGNGVDAIAFGSGSLSGARVWQNLGVPYIMLGSQDVAADGALTVEPGVVVQFDQYGQLSVAGRLEAEGTAAQPITFTGNFTTPASGWWSGLHVYYGTAQLDYVTVEYAGYSQGGSLQTNGGVVTVTRSAIRNGSADGVWAYGSGVIHVSDSLIAGNAGYALEYANSTVAPQLSGLTITGNGVDAIAFGSGSLSGARVWQNLGVPYIMLGSQDVAADGALTVEPGVVVQFDQYGQLSVAGRLEAEGTAAQPITFTGNFTTPASGWWSGLHVYYGTAQLDYVTVEYAGYSQGGSLQTNGGVVTVTRSAIRNGSADGVWAYGSGVIHVSDSLIAGNAGYALEYANSTVAPQLSGLTITGNGVDAIAFGSGSISGARVWQNLGVPYIILGNQYVVADGALAVEPGVEVQFDQYTQLQVEGRLAAVGTAAQPITFTGHFTTPMAGWWNGLTIWYGAATLDYVTVAYGGYSQDSNIYIYNGQASIAHSQLSHSSGAGLYAATGGVGVSVEQSQVISNTGYGIWNNYPESLLMAANNWWGSASGPTADGDCNPGGTGSPVSMGVVYRPFLSAPNAEPPFLEPRDVYLLQVSPSRWFVPADGSSTAWISVTMRTGAGQPLPNHAVHLSTSLGDLAESELTTNAAGQAFAYLTSLITGTAFVTVTSGGGDVCSDWAIPAYTQISFVAEEDSPLTPDGEAPYLNNALEVEPEPIVQGVPSTITLRLTNPFSAPITVNGTMGYLQFGIGQTFGPVKEITDWVIPAHSEQTLHIPWTPPLSGHYCLEFHYWYTGGSARMAALAGKNGRAGKNMDVQPGSTLPPKQKDLIEKGQLASSAIDDGTTLLQLLMDLKGTLMGMWGNAIPQQIFGNILSFNFESYGAAGCALAGGESCGGWSGPKLQAPAPFGTLGNMMDSAPRQDYSTPTRPPRIQLPTYPDLYLAGQDLLVTAPITSDIPPARLQALSDLVTATLDLHINLYAAVVAQDRWAGATEANDLEWSAQQSAAFLYYKQKAGSAMLRVADTYDALIAELQSEGIVDIVVTADDIRAYQERLQTQGFTELEIRCARELGLTDAGIEAARQRRLAVDPDKAAGSVMGKWQELAAALRALGNSFVSTYTFPEQIPGGAGAAASEDNNLAQFFQSVFTLQVGNPLSQTATVELHVRRLDIPNDWIVSADWITATLAAGEQTTATVTVIPASASVQGTQPKVAIEGYIGDQLVGGVVLGVAVPEYVPFTPPSEYLVYLPLLMK